MESTVHQRRTLPCTCPLWRQHSRHRKNWPKRVQYHRRRRIGVVWRPCSRYSCNACHVVWGQGFLLGRPTCRRTYSLTRILSSSFFLSSFFVSYSPRSLNGTQPKPATCSELSAICKCMSAIWDIPSPTNRGFKIHIIDHFTTERQL